VYVLLSRVRSLSQLRSTIEETSYRSVDFSLDTWGPRGIHDSRAGTVGPKGPGPAAEKVLGMPKKVRGMPKILKSSFKCLVTSAVIRDQDPHQQMQNEIVARLLSFSTDPTTREIQIIENSSLEPVNPEKSGLIL